MECVGFILLYLCTRFRPERPLTSKEVSGKKMDEVVTIEK